MSQRSLRSRFSRRAFIGTSASLAIPCLVPAGALGRNGQVAPSERVTLGVLGTGGRGTANMVYGPIQNAVAKAIVDKLADGTIPERIAYTHVMFVQATVDPQALDRRDLHRNGYEATCAALGGAFMEAE